MDKNDTYTLQKLAYSFMKNNKIEKAFKQFNHATKLDKR